MDYEKELNNPERKNPICKCGKEKETPNTLMCWSCWKK